jgi:lysozyme family protein
MKTNFDASLAKLLVHEGGFVNHPADPGGMTNLGCTKTVWEEHCGYSVDEKAMRALTPAHVAPLYKRKYWDKIKGDELPDGLDYAVFDCAINSGSGRAAKLLQACIGVDQDGGIGSKTLAAVNAHAVTELIQEYSERRLAFLKALPGWSTFGNGWGRRVAEVQAASIAMLA